MSRVKCSKCGKLAHIVIEGKTYCTDCAPKPTMPVVIEETVVNEVVIEKMERPKPWPDSSTDRILPEDEQLTEYEYFRPLGKRVETKKPWWKRWFGF